MFGYVIPYKSELKIKEYDLFKANYCGLCKTMGKEFNQIARFGLNYDLNFLALLLSSLDSDRYVIKREGCFANPIKKKLVIDSNKHLVYTSNISIMLIYFKLVDDWKDEKSLKSLTALIPYSILKRKAMKKYKEKFNSIKVNLDKLAQLEKEKCSIIDEVADSFGKLMEEIAVPTYITDKNTVQILRWLGYNLGRWIYILDAFNDMDRDIKKNNYNPIILQYNYDFKEEISSFALKVKKPIEFNLTLTLDNIAKSLELLDIKKNKSIIDNIVYMGMRHKMENILGKQVENNNEKSL